MWKATNSLFLNGIINSRTRVLQPWSDAGRHPGSPMGLLSSEPRTVKDVSIVPMDLVLDLCPPAPKYPDEIKAIIDEGVITEEAAFLVRVDGHKEGKPVRIDSYANAPGLVESFELSELSHEAYMTGQCAAVFVKMMVENTFLKKGVYVPEQLDADTRIYFFKELAKLGVTVDEIIEAEKD